MYFTKEFIRNEDMYPYLLSNKELLNIQGDPYSFPDWLIRIITAVSGKNNGPPCIWFQDMLLQGTLPNVTYFMLDPISRYIYMTSHIL